MKNKLGIVWHVSLLSLATSFVATGAHAQTDITAYGTNALVNNTTGDYNSAFGAHALRSNTTGSGNTSTGRGAMYKNTGGNDNTAVGLSALYWNTNASESTAVGSSALENNIGQMNTAVGSKALFNNTTGTHNTALGRVAAISNTTGVSNVAVGASASYYNTTGFGNTAVGDLALYLNNGGSYNTAVGDDALAYTTGSYNTGVGKDSGATGNFTNTGSFGYNAKAAASNTIVIGNSAVTQIGGYVGWSNLSDGRYKTNVKQNVPGLEFIKRLKPVTYSWDASKLNEIDGAEKLATDAKLGEGREAKAKKVYTGFIAQDVEAAAKDCGYDFSGVVRPANESSRYQLTYSEFVVPLVKAVQEQQKEIEALRETVRALKPNARLTDGASGGSSRYAAVLGGSIAMVGALLVFLQLKQRKDNPAGH